MKDVSGEMKVILSTFPGTMSATPMATREDRLLRAARRALIDRRPTPGEE
jgi:hypothetical protein